MNLIKKTQPILLILLYSIFSISCQEDTDMTDTQIVTSYTQNIPIVIKKTKGYFDLRRTESLGIDNNQTHDYLNNVKQINIENISYQIMNFKGIACVIDSLSIKMGNYTIIEHKNIDIKQSFLDKVVFNPSNTNALKAAARQFNSDKSINLEYYLNGAKIQDDVTFTIQLTVATRILAKYLD